MARYFYYPFIALDINNCGVNEFTLAQMYKYPGNNSLTVTRALKISRFPMVLDIRLVSFLPILSSGLPAMSVLKEQLITRAGAWTPWETRVSSVTAHLPKSLHVEIPTSTNIQVPMKGCAFSNINTILFLVLHIHSPQQVVDSCFPLFKPGKACCCCK